MNDKLKYIHIQFEMNVTLNNNAAQLRNVSTKCTKLAFVLLKR